MDELSQLALQFSTDKYGHHFYTPIYFRYLQEYRQKEVRLLEIGIGGYEYPKVGGAGLKMWAGFFYRGKVFGIDIYDKSFLDDAQITTFIVSQTDKEHLTTLVESIGPLDIIVDDGSHINSHVIRSFEILFPLLKEGGFYFVEDCHTSYWEELGADGTDFEGGNHPNTTMNYFKRLTDSVNYEHSKGRVLHNVVNDIEFIAFHKELICVKKKDKITS